MQGSTIDILLVEDSPGDVRLTQEALREGKVDNTLHVAYDGEEALAFLRRGGDFADSPRPDLVLLDLNLPRVDGRTVLAEMKGDPDLKSIPVIVLTTSDADEDVLQSYDLSANCYICKPVEYQRFVEVVRTAADFWLTIVRLPSQVGQRSP